MDQAVGAKRQDGTKPKPKLDNMIRVEQIDGDVETAEDIKQSSESTTNNNNKYDNNMKRLTLPELEAEESSDSSSQLSPHTESNEEAVDDESIAVNCHSNPSEVIVRGKNVKQIRVKFLPRPPPHSEDVSGTSTGRRRQHRQANGSSGTDHVMKSANQSADENIPYSKEETSLPAIEESPTEPNTGRIGSSTSYYSQDPELYNNQCTSSVGSRTTSSLVDWDWKHKQDVLSGLEYFERKAQEFKDLYNRSQREIERLKSCNLDLENRLQTLSIEMKSLMAESDELKIKLDESEKENDILRSQAISEWQSRVKAEEMYFELKRDLQQELANLKKNSASQEKANNCSSEVQTQVNKEGAPEEIRKESQPKNEAGLLSDETFELKHSVATLTEDIRKLNREKELILENNKQLIQDLDKLTATLQKKDLELESQYKRFLSLKKSFNGLMEENETLKGQLRMRGIGQHTGTREQITNILANCTWPAGKLGGSTQAEVERVSYIDLPKDSLPVSNSNGGAFRTTTSGLQATAVRSRRNSLNSKSSKPAGAHSTMQSTAQSTIHSTVHSTVRGQVKRTKAETVTVGDNLPPVNSTVR